MWAHIQDEEVLEQCVRVPIEWRTLIRRAIVAGVAMNGDCLLYLEGPQLVGNLRLIEDLGGISGGTLSVEFCMYGLGSPFLYRVLDTHFCTHRGGGIHGPTGDCTCVFFVKTDDLHDIYIYIYIYIYTFYHACRYALCFYV
jgi:hypothetical protein